jgi:hypothetical protein
LLGAVGVSVGGCAPALQVTRVESAEEKPANVLLFFRVQAGVEPVPGLDGNAFSVKEDERIVGLGPDRVIVNPDLRGAQATIVLVDLGGHPAQTELDAMAAAVGILADRIGASRRLGVYALDGAEQPMPLAPIGASAEVLKAAAAKIPQYKPRDPSLDLNGGYVLGVRALEKALPPNTGPKIGNLVLLARGADRASRMTSAQVDAEVRGTTVDLGRFAIAFGVESQVIKLDSFANPWFVASTAEALTDAATRIADAIDARGRSYYLLSYCSSARAGEHKLKLDVAREHTPKNGRTEIQRGSLFHTFKADGFGPGCTPSVPDGWRPEPAKAVTLAPH